MKNKPLALVAAMAVMTVMTVSALVFLPGCSLTIAEEAIETFIHVEEALFAEEVAEDVVEDMKKDEKSD